MRVIDLSCVVSSKMVNLQLADFGAEVIKIEDTIRGVLLQDWQTEGVNVQRKVYSRNKNGLALNLRARRGRELLSELIAGAQVRVENFRPSTPEVMGLAPDDLRRRNPVIIVLVPAWGQDRSYRDVFRTRDGRHIRILASILEEEFQLSDKEVGQPQCVLDTYERRCRRVLVP